MKTEEQELRGFLKFVESQSNISLSDRELHNYFRMIANVAKTQTGYKKLCWEVGEWLLLLSDDRQEKYFDLYGHETIGEALLHTLMNGTLPAGLGWYVSRGFLPTDVDVDSDIMLSVLTHPIIEAKLTQCLSTVELRIDLELLDASDQLTGTALVTFLSHLHRFGLDNSTQLMWAARLVQHFSLEHPAQRLAIDLVLKCLIQAQRYTNAFFWLQAYYAEKIYGDKEEVIFGTVSELIKNTLILDIRGCKILARLSYDKKLIQITSSFQSERTQLLLGFLTLWLLAEKGLPTKQDFIDQSAGLLWSKYPNISRFMVLLSNWSFELTTLSDSNNMYSGVADYLEAPDLRAVALNEIKQLLTLSPNYNRGGHFTLELWQEIRNKVFYPLISGLESPSRRDIEKARSKVATLEPDALIDNSATFRFGHRASKRLEGGVRQIVFNDFNEYIDKLLIIADLSKKFLVVRKFICELEKEIDWRELYQECDDFVNELPCLNDYVECYFLPLVDACAKSG